jgi:hypothetical protein
MTQPVAMQPFHPNSSHPISTPFPTDWGPGTIQTSPFHTEAKKEKKQSLRFISGGTVESNPIGYLSPTLNMLLRNNPIHLILGLFHFVDEDSSLVFLCGQNSAHALGFAC